MAEDAVTDGAPPQPRAIPGWEGAAYSPAGDAAPPPYSPPTTTPPYAGPPAYGAPTGFPPPAAFRTDTRRKTLAIVAFVLALVGTFVAFTPFVSFGAWLLLIPALVLGIVALARKDQGGKGFSIAAIIVSIVSFFIAFVFSIGSLFLFGSGGSDGADTTAAQPEASSASEPINLTPGGGGSYDAPLAFGEAATIGDFDTQDRVWEISVGSPVDMTTDLAAPELNNTAPTNGAYIVIPVTATYLGEGTVDVAFETGWGLGGYWIDPAGEFHADSYAQLPAGMPTAYQVGVVNSGDTVTFYIATDAPADLGGRAMVSVGYSGMGDMYWAAR